MVTKLLPYNKSGTRLSYLTVWSCKSGIRFLNGGVYEMGGLWEFSLSHGGHRPPDIIIFPCSETDFPILAMCYTSFLQKRPFMNPRSCGETSLLWNEAEGPTRMLLWGKDWLGKELRAFMEAGISLKPTTLDLESTTVSIVLLHCTFTRAGLSMFARYLVN